MPRLNDIIARDFRAALADGGIALTWPSPDGDHAFTAMPEQQEADSREYAGSVSDDTDVFFRAIRADLKSTSGAYPKSGDAFVDEEQALYTIKQSIPLPGTPFWRFRCEVTA